MGRDETRNCPSADLVAVPYPSDCPGYHCSFPLTDLLFDQRGPGKQAQKSVPGSIRTDGCASMGQSAPGLFQGIIRAPRASDIFSYYSRGRKESFSGKRSRTERHSVSGVYTTSTRNHGFQSSILRSRRSTETVSVISTAPGKTSFAEGKSRKLFFKKDQSGHDSNYFLSFLDFQY